MKIKSTILITILLFTWCSLSYSEGTAPKIFKGKLAFHSTRFVLDKRYKSGGVCLLKDGKVTFIAKAAEAAWSPDGSLLMAVPDSTGIYILKEDGTIIEEIPTSTKASYPQWHPKENKIFYVGQEIEEAKDPSLAYLMPRYNKKIYMYDRDKKETTLLFYDSNKKYNILGLYISPDGKHLAFMFTGELEGTYVFDIDSKSIELVYKHGLIRGWFPDGNLCYGANIDENENLMTPIGSTAGYLFKYNIGTKAKEKIGYDAFSSFQKLSRDGKYIYYSNGAGIWVAPIEDVSKAELIVKTVVINPKNGNTSQEFESDWFQE